MKGNFWLKLIILALFLGVIGTGSYFLLLPQLKSKVIPIVADKSFGWKFPVAKFPLTGDQNSNLIAYSNIRDPGGVPQGLPVRLKIPVISVDSAIEDAQITPDGRMDVPAGSVNVAWFSLGPHPGQEGSAVIGGHFGITNGKPFVFYKLDKVRVNDKVYIVDDKGDTLAFQVRRIQSFDRNADATTVFTSNDGKAHLNLITCEGIWNQVNGAYPLRLVVFADAIPPEGAVAIKTPAPVAKLPRTAIDNSTASPSSMPSVTPEPIIEEPTLSPDSTENTPVADHFFMTSIKNLYSTPINGAITTFLLISIGFIVIKIIRR